jgi:hypothetical protein
MKPYKGYTPAQRMAVCPLLDEARADGRLPEPNKCSTCGQTEGSIGYHSDDYAHETLIENTRVLCYSCHMVHHIYHNNRQNEGAKIYIHMVRDRGWMFKSNNNNFGKLIAGLNYLKKNYAEYLPEEEIENI